MKSTALAERWHHTNNVPLPRRPLYRLYPQRRRGKHRQAIQWQASPLIELAFFVGLLGGAAVVWVISRYYR